MADAVTILLADAVVAELNAAPGGTFDIAFTAERRYSPRQDRSDYSVARVTVVGRTSEDQAAETRGSNAENAIVDIGVMKQTDPESLTENDAMSELAQQVKDYMTRRELTAYDAARWQRGGVQVTDPDSHDEQNLFTAVVRLNYKVMRNG